MKEITWVDGMIQAAIGGNMAAGLNWPNIKKAAGLAGSAWREWVADRCDGLAGALAFHGGLALPLFMACLLLGIAALFGEHWTRLHVIPVMAAWLGPYGTEAVKVLLLQTKDISPQTALGLGVLAAIGLFLGASGFFLMLQDSLQTIWNIRREQPGIKAQAKKRLWGLVYTAASGLIVIAILLLASLIFWLTGITPGVGSIGILSYVLSIALAFVAFWALVSFWFASLLPVRLKRRQILIAAAAIAAMHLLGRLILSFRLPVGRPEIDTAQAAIIWLLWLYYASMVFLYGAELMHLYLRRYGGVQDPM